MQQGEADAVRLEKQAEADGLKAVKKAEADGLLFKLSAEADGVEQILTKKAKGFTDIVNSAERDKQLATMLLLIEQMPKLVEEQAKAISNLKIDKVTVWDNGKGKDGKGSTADFVSGLVGSLPPLHEITKNAGIELPEYLGKVQDGESKAEEAPEPPKKAQSAIKRAVKKVVKKPPTKAEDPGKTPPPLSSGDDNPA